MKREELYKLQNEVLSALSEFAGEHDFPFVLTGGTALVRFLLRKHYRISCDLDFFSNRFNVFENWNKKELEFFLLQKFEVVTFLNLSSSTLKMWRGVIGYENALVDVDFVDDQFSGIFETVTLREFPNLNIETIEAIYFRKLFAVITGIKNEKVVDRIKDVVDLIQLDGITPLVDFLRDIFIPVLEQNAGTLNAREFLTKFSLLHRIIDRNSVKIEEILKETLLTKLTVRDVLRWLERKLRELTQYFQQNL